MIVVGSNPASVKPINPLDSGIPPHEQEAFLQEAWGETNQVLCYTPEEEISRNNEQVTG